MAGTHEKTALQLDQPEPAWLTERRDQARLVRATATMPTATLEEWRYVELGFDLEDFAPATQPGPALTEDSYLTALPDQGGSVQLVDGYLTQVEADGVVVGTPAGLAEGKWATTVEQHYAASVSSHTDIFAAAHNAHGPAGATIVLPPGHSMSHPVVVDAQSVTGGTVGFPHITVVAGANSRAQVVVVYRSAPGVDLLVVPVVEAYAQEGAHLSLSVVQHLADTARMVAHHHYVTGRDATLRIDEVGLGGGFARQRAAIDLHGDGSSVKLGGIYFGDTNQTVDYRMFITHQGRHTNSDIFLKGAVADNARAVWSGLMRIEKSALGTSAFETNRNLVLSDGAKVHSVPNLEILTDDLQCGHGSSSGPLEQEHMYYLMSRGIAPDRAERLLVRGFFDEILSDLAEPSLATPARQAVGEKFAGAQQRSASSKAGS